MKSNVIFVALMLFLGWSLSSCNDEVVVYDIAQATNASDALGNDRGNHPPVVGTFHTNSDQIGGNLRLMRYMTADEWELE